MSCNPQQSNKFKNLSNKENYRRTSCESMRGLFSVSLKRITQVINQTLHTICRTTETKRGTKNQSKNDKKPYLTDKNKQICWILQRKRRKENTFSFHISLALSHSHQMIHDTRIPCNTLQADYTS